MVLEGGRDGGKCLLASTHSLTHHTQQTRSEPQRGEEEKGELIEMMRYTSAAMMDNDGGERQLTREREREETQCKSNTVSIASGTHTDTSRGREGEE